MDKESAQHIEFLAEHLLQLVHRVHRLEKEFIIMAEDFSALSGQIDRAVGLINDAVTILKNPTTDNNNQDVINALTIRLQGAADALAAVENPVVVSTPAPAPEPVADPAPATTDTPPAA